ncbi:hypothetical protein [Aeromonas salmonicida]|uniref:hypothetical protein n=1 Tax=Aeromonas salmonicida TaxID=645 RepID=UPI003D1A8741
MRLCFLVILFLSLNANAITIRGQFSLLIDNAAIIPIENNGDKHALVGVSIVEIASPETGKVIEMQGGELLFTPSKQIIRKKSKGNFKFSFQGGLGDKERYFRVVFTELSVDRLTRKETVPDKKSSDVSASVGVGYVLILPPKIPRQQYLLNRKGITNVGNLTLLARAYGKNEKGDDISFVMPLSPAKTISLKKFGLKDDILGSVEGIKKESFTLLAE